MLTKYIHLLSRSKTYTPQHQLELLTDIHRRGFLKQIIDITLFSTLASQCCALPSEYSSFLPDMGDSDRTNLSVVEANFIGKQVIQDITNHGNMLIDYDVLAYINDIGNNLVSYSPMATENFNFYMIKDKQINAFALPGGHICLCNGLIFCTQTEDELTAVMSHEISHVVQHHIFRNIANYHREQWKSIAGTIAGGLIAMLNPSAGMLAITGAQGLSVQNMLAFSRDFEREADRVGQKIMCKAGYDPHAMPSFFQRLRDTTKFNDNEIYAFLRTHPVTSERLSEAQERANQLGTKMRPDSISFLLIREKCRILQIGIIDAINFYTNSLKNKKYISIDAQYYGLALAQYYNKKYFSALTTLNKINTSSYKMHPAVISLQALLYAANNNFELANETYALGLDQYPTYKNLWLGQVDLYINTKKFMLASHSLEEQSLYYPLDLDIWSRSAKINADTMLNNEQKYYYALGNIHYILANYKLALDAYLKAAKVRNADAMLNNIISAKIIDTKDIIRSNTN